MQRITNYQPNEIQHHINTWKASPIGSLKMKFDLFPYQRNIEDFKHSKPIKFKIKLIGKDFHSQKFRTGKFDT